MTRHIPPQTFNNTHQLLRSFFLARGFEEVHTQNRLSILAACEDPSTIATYTYNNHVWPLPQTGQMWLEHELLKNPHVPGLFCLSTSYREEKKPIANRHESIFPMFEFEFPGTVDDLEKMERELVVHLGLSSPDGIVAKDYTDWCTFFQTNALEHSHEESMFKHYPYEASLIKNFPNQTSPFWNMKQNGNGTAAKIDVILGGQETIGSAERSCNPQEMLDMFHSISEGAYAKLLFEKFGQLRVEKELHAFLNMNFFPRVGGGIGITRLINAIKRYQQKEIFNQWDKAS